MGMPYPNAKSRTYARRHGGAIITPDDPRMADHYFSPTKGFKRISPRRSRAANLMAKILQGEHLLLGKNNVGRFIKLGY